MKDSSERNGRAIKVIKNEHGNYVPKPKKISKPSAPKDLNKVTHPRSGSVSTYDKVAFLGPLIESGNHTLAELTKMMLEKFPTLSESTVKTFLVDSKNPKYSKFEKLVVVTEKGKLNFK